jgi:hypothetical protein
MIRVLITGVAGLHGRRRHGGGGMDGEVYNAGPDRPNLTKDELARLLQQRLPLQAFYGPVGGTRTSGTTR